MARLANKINLTVGKRAVLTYEEHKWIPISCFGETGYFVPEVRETAEAPIQTP